MPKTKITEDANERQTAANSGVSALSGDVFTMGFNEDDTETCFVGCHALHARVGAKKNVFSGEAQLADYGLKSSTVFQ